MLPTSNSSESVDDEQPPAAYNDSESPPVASTELLDKSDISYAIKQACGLSPSDDLKPPLVLDMVKKREVKSCFTSGQKSKIMGNFLPNTPKEVAWYSKKPFCGTFSKDGKYLLTTTHDRVIHLYEHNNGNYKVYKNFSVSAVGWSILDTAFSPDGNHFVYSSWSDYLYMHSVHGDPNHKEPLLLDAENPMFCVFSVVFSHDGRELFCGGNDGHLYIYDRATQQCTNVRGHSIDINSVAFADDSSQILYSAGDDELCKVWDRRTLREDDPRPVGVLVGHMGGITYIDPRGDGRHLITNSKDQTIKLWDARVFSSKKIQQQAESSGSITWDYRWQHVPKKFLYARKPLEGDTSLMTYRGHIVVQTLIRCHFSPAATTGQRYIYTGCGTGCVIIYDLLTGKMVKTLKDHKAVVRDVSWHPYNQEIVSTSWDCKVISWRWRNRDIESSDELERYEYGREESDQMQNQPVRRSKRLAEQQQVRNFI